MLLQKRIPWTYIVKKIRVEIILVVAYSTLIGVWHHELDINHITIPLAVPAILGTILSLLLAFRSNQAYDRWWEARIVWGAIVNDSRSLMRQLQCFVYDPEFSVDSHLFIERFGKRQIAWTFALGRSLRNQKPLDANESNLSDSEKRWTADYSNVPNALLLLHSKDIQFALRSNWINPYQQVELDQTITRLCDAMGKCERIKKTVFPTTYSVYIHFALYLFILLLPFSLTQSVGFVQVPLVVGISSTFLLIEKMAIYLQDPFENKPTDTPVTAIAQTIEGDLKQMMNLEQHRERTSEKAKGEDVLTEFYVL